jgi:glycosyltransferase involved in cell wall biosynthesis
MKKIAIIVPTYNSAKTIEMTLDSIKSQVVNTSSEISVFVRDDCSSDNTIQIAEKSWHSNQNSTLVHSNIPIQLIKNEKNLGERGNLNSAISEISATRVDWFLILHSDDIAKANWLKIILARIECCGDEVGSICSSWDNLMEDGSIEPGEDNCDRTVELIQGDQLSVRNTLLKGCWWHISGCAIRLKTFEDVGGFAIDMPQQGDWEWLLRCLSKGWAVEYIPRTLILYRQHSASVSSSSYKTHRDISESLKIFRQYQRFLSARDYLKLHLLKSSYLLRRMVRSLIELNTQRFILAWIILFEVIGNLVKWIWGIKYID